MTSIGPRRRCWSIGSGHRSRFRERLVGSGVASPQQLADWEEEVEGHVNSAADRAAEDPWPGLEQIAAVRLA